jgi:hypothetical protein
MELFVVGTFWFWALVVAWIIMLFIFIENENGIGATISMIIFGCCLQFFGNVDFLGYVMENPLTIAMIVGSYFLLGGIWGCVKWWVFCRDRWEEYMETKEEFLRSKGLPAGTKVVPDEFKLEWTRKLKQHGEYRGRTLADTPRVRDNKGKILRWMSFWPVSLIWSLINDFVKRVFKTIYQKIAGFLQRIADNMFAGAQDDLVDEDQVAQAERQEEYDRRTRGR